MGVPERNSKECGEDDSVDSAVQRQALVVLESQEALRANDAGAVEHLQETGSDADDEEHHREENLDQDDRSETRLDVDSCVRQRRGFHFNVFR